MVPSSGPSTFKRCTSNMRFCISSKLGGPGAWPETGSSWWPVPGIRGSKLEDRGHHMGSHRILAGSPGVARLEGKADWTVSQRFFGKCSLATGAGAGLNSMARRSSCANAFVSYEKNTFKNNLRCPKTRSTTPTAIFKSDEHLK